MCVGDGFSGVVRGHRLEKDGRGHAVKATEFNAADPDSLIFGIIARKSQFSLNLSDNLD